MKERIQNLEDKIATEKEKNLAIKKDIALLKKRFLTNDKEFNTYIKTKITTSKTEALAKIQEFKISNSKKYNTKKKALMQKIKEAKVELKIFNSTVKKRQEGISGFDIEVKYLFKDFYNILKLLGTDKLYTYIYEKKELNFLIPVYNFLVTQFIKNLFIKNKIYKSLEDVGLLKQFAYRYPHEFSGGQRQRIVIARALITKPKVIVADEPIASLDISIQAQVVNLLKDLCKEKNIGMIFIAHDLSMIEYVADRVQIMHLGKIVESGKTEKIYDNPIHPYTNNLFKAIPKMSNANEKFKNVSFELSYLQDQIYPNVPTIHEVEEDHFVYGTDAQISKWTKNKTKKLSK